MKVVCYIALGFFYAASGLVCLRSVRDHRRGRTVDERPHVWIGAFGFMVYMMLGAATAIDQ